MRSKRALWALLALAVTLVLLTAGCAKRTPLADAASAGIDVWVRLETEEGESVTGVLVSLDARAIVVDTRHTLSDDVRVRDRAGRRGLYSGTERLPGEVVEVESGEAGRTAVVRRTFRALEIESATFHEGSGQRSLANILSHILGPIVGGTLGLII